MIKKCHKDHKKHSLVSHAKPFTFVSHTVTKSKVIVWLTRLNETAISTINMSRKDVGQTFLLDLFIWTTEVTIIFLHNMSPFYLDRFVYKVPESKI